MNDGRYCPACDKDIGLLSVFLAAWPTRLKCPHCKSRLRYDINVWRTFSILVLPLSVVLLALSLMLMHFIFGNLDPIPLVLSLVLFTVLWAAFEVISAVYWRSHKTLRIVKVGSNNGMKADQ